jgi:hypothetical protein
MHAIKINAEIDNNGEIHLKLPPPRRPGPARVIVLFDPDQPIQVGGRGHRPSTRLAGQGARLHGDDIAPAFSPEEWGDLYR